MRRDTRGVWIPVRAFPACLAAVLLAACHGAPGALWPKPQPESSDTVETEGAPRPVDVTTLGAGAAPGNAKSPGGFVPRGSMRNFYAGARNRLWYYMNCYYWVADTAPREDLWIKADVSEQFRELRRWPDGDAVPDSEPKVTVEYWEVGKNGRTIRLDNHKDYLRLKDQYSAGKIVVEVTLTLGRLHLKDKRDRWVEPDEAYVLESRNYRGGGGVGADGARFVPLATEAVTTWSYEIPWDTHPQRLTRSNWKRTKLPTWKLANREAPPNAPGAAPPVVTPRAE